MVLLRRAKAFQNEKDDKAELSGFAFKYDEIAETFQSEKMSPDMEIKVMPETFLFRGHDPDRILGKVGVNLTLENRKEGLHFRVDKLPDTELARDTMELVRMGILNGVSAGFFEDESEDKDGIHVFKKIRLAELSLVSMPAYDSGRLDRAKITYLKKEPYRTEKDMKKEPKPPEMY